MAIPTQLDATQLQTGLASFLNRELRIYPPSKPRLRKQRFDVIERGDQFRWVVRTVSNYLLDAGRKCDFVVGVVLVSSKGMELIAFTSKHELASQVGRRNALASYDFHATRALDEEMGDIWVLKLTQGIKDE